VSLCAVGVGSNLGDRMAHLNAALSGLRAVSAIEAVSSVYETAPIGGPDQGAYLNAVVLIETARTPIGLLRELLLIERARGRVREVRWGPRTLDLDLLLFGRASIDIAGLTVPHPQIRHRRFVLEPLNEVWPDARMPDGSAVGPATGMVAGQVLDRLGIRFGDPEPMRT
jgi:2-amino-4-hydroxy-6-hydroxymethyldihydropteridine diphosphokinase